MALGVRHKFSIQEFVNAAVISVVNQGINTGLSDSGALSGDSAYIHIFEKDVIEGQVDALIATATMGIKFDPWTQTGTIVGTDAMALYMSGQGLNVNDVMSSSKNRAAEQAKTAESKTGFYAPVVLGVDDAGSSQQSSKDSLAKHVPTGSSPPSGLYKAKGASLAGYNTDITESQWVRSVMEYQQQTAPSTAPFNYSAAATNLPSAQVSYGHFMEQVMSSSAPTRSFPSWSENSPSSVQPSAQNAGDLWRSAESGLGSVAGNLLVGALLPAPIGAMLNWRGTGRYSSLDNLTYFAESFTDAALGINPGEDVQSWRMYNRSSISPLSLSKLDAFEYGVSHRNGFTNDLASYSRSVGWAGGEAAARNIDTGIDILFLASLAVPGVDLIDAGILGVRYLTAAYAASKAGAGVATVGKIAGSGLSFMSDLGKAGGVGGLADDSNILGSFGEVPERAFRSVGASTRRFYVKSPKHGATVRGNINPAPVNGQEALDSSVLIKHTTTRRIGFDSDTGDFVVFDQTLGKEYHGHTRTWGQLTTQMQNALVDSGMANRRGKLTR